MFVDFDYTQGNLRLGAYIKWLIYKYKFVITHTMQIFEEHPDYPRTLSNFCRIANNLLTSKEYPMADMRDTTLNGYLLDPFLDEVLKKKS